ncbi:MAG: hypothetical protein GTO02_07835 [Candidatus Dadabacteria bacterium]|nr:hypothetical protein [Candidatus Dadabacteria bacterium]
MSDLKFNNLNTLNGKFENYILTLNMRANYQPVILRALLDGRKQNKTELANRLLNANPNIKKNLTHEKRIKYFKHVPVWHVLKNHLESFVKVDTENKYYLDLELSKDEIQYFEKLLTIQIRKINEVYIH